MESGFGVKTRLEECIPSYHEEFLLQPSPGFEAGLEGPSIELEILFGNPHALPMSLFIPVIEILG